jgi:hypothetical protein
MTVARSSGNEPTIHREASPRAKAPQASANETGLAASASPKDFNFRTHPRVGTTNPHSRRSSGRAILTPSLSSVPEKLARGTLASPLLLADNERVSKSCTTIEKTLSCTRGLGERNGHASRRGPKTPSSFQCVSISIFGDCNVKQTIRRHGCRVFRR